MYCRSCHKPVKKRQHSRGHCATCYGRLKRAGKTPPAGTKPLTELPSAGATLRAYQEEDDSPFEDATTAPGVDGVVQALERLQRATDSATEALRHLHRCMTEVDNMTRVSE